MKAAAFDYLRPASIAEACEQLAADAGARVLAGGQTLIPMLAMRLARPTFLINIASIPELSGIRDTGTSVRIGATATQAAAVLNAKNTTTTWMESCRIMVDALGGVTLTIHTASAGQRHETLAATAAGEVLDIDPDSMRVVRTTSLESLPGSSPVGSRMAIMLGGAVYRAAHKLRDRLIARAAHRFGVAAGELRYRNGGVEHPSRETARWGTVSARRGSRSRRRTEAR
jgi:CO/xanthine dehydrogenase Mo-binding subunit